MSKTSDLTRFAHGTQKFIIQINYSGFRILGIFRFELNETLFKVHLVPGKIKNLSGPHTRQEGELDNLGSMERKV